LNSYRIGHRDDDDDSSRIGHRDDDDSNRIGLSVPFVSVPFDWGHYIGTGIGVKDGHSAQLESAQTKQASKPAQKALVTGKHSQSKQRDDHSTILVLSSLTLTLTLNVLSSNILVVHSNLKSQSKSHRKTETMKDLHLDRHMAFTA
jgi:hypothetical protein